MEMLSLKKTMTTPVHGLYDADGWAAEQWTREHWTFDRRSLAPTDRSFNASNRFVMCECNSDLCTNGIHYNDDVPVQTSESSIYTVSRSVRRLSAVGVITNTSSPELFWHRRTAYTHRKMIFNDCVCQLRATTRTRTSSLDLNYRKRENARRTQGHGLAEPQRRWTIAYARIRIPHMAHLAW